MILNCFTGRVTDSNKGKANNTQSDDESVVCGDSVSQKLW